MGEPIKEFRRLLENRRPITGRSGVNVLALWRICYDGEDQPALRWAEPPDSLWVRLSADTFR